MSAPSESQSTLSNRVDQNNFTTKEMLIILMGDMKDLRAQVGTISTQVVSMVAAKSEDRLCELEETRIPKIEQWQSKATGVVAVISTILAISVTLAGAILSHFKF